MDGPTTALSLGTFPPGDGTCISKGTRRRSPSVSASTKKPGLEMWASWTARPASSHQDSEMSQRAKATLTGSRGGDPSVLPDLLVSTCSLPSLRNGTLTPHHHTDSRPLRPTTGAEGQNTLEVTLPLNTVLISHSQTSLTKGLTHLCSEVLLLPGS